MPLTPEEELELKRLQEEQLQISTQLEEVRKQLAPAPTQPEQEQVDTGMFEAFARGGAQELLPSMADEATARAESILTGKPYEKALEESRAEYKAAEEQHPVPYFLGGLAGGVAQGIGLTALTGGAAAPAVAATKAAQVAQKATALSRLVSSAKKVGQAAKVGAVMGGLHGYGASEKEGLEALKEVPMGMMTGGIVGGGIGTVVEGAKGVGKFIAEDLEKRVAAGKFSENAPTVLSIIKKGFKDIGYTSQASINKIVQNVYDVADNIVKPKLIQNITDTRRLRNYILENTEGTIDLETPIKDLIDKLTKYGGQDALSVIKELQDAYNAALSKGYLTYRDANDITRRMSDHIRNKPEYASTIKSMVYENNKDIQNLLANRITAKQAASTVSKDKEMLSLYRKYVLSLSDEKLAKDILEETTEQLSPQEALKRAKNIKQTLQTVAGAFSDEDPTLVSDVIKDPAIQASLESVLEKTSPLKILNRKMHKILNASSILGDVIDENSEAEAINNTIKIFRNLVAQHKDGPSALEASMKFNKMLENLEDADPDLLKEINENVMPAIESLKELRYVKGGGFDKGGQDTPLVEKSKMGGIVGRTAAQLGNIAAQTISAAKQGKPGPIEYLPTTFILNPDLKILNLLRDKAQQNNINWAIEALDKAINSNDRSKRMALLNTLMQYKSMRELFKDPEMEALMQQMEEEKRQKEQENR